jgi:hypothetical protein
MKMFDLIKRRENVPKHFILFRKEEKFNNKKKGLKHILSQLQK